MTAEVDNLRGREGRCPWALTDPLLLTYHDDEWGRPVPDEQGVYERIMLEGFQAGLSWLVILRKRPAFREAFAGFDPDVVAAYSEQDVARLLGNVGIVRNRAKIQAAVTNARATIALRGEGGLAAIVSSHQPPASAPPRTPEDIPTISPESRALSSTLRRKGFAFVGPTTMYALMQATGMVNDHLADCPQRPK